ncbi:DEAD/DEAH box helicase [Microbulbifer marinus]|uniref:Helicase conserved C-terminal domain-containing protein n=1 Tax=Microbulbifer marinus TaxID=658218 RepID=A0A1H3WH59_9GAMM|nr:DEAD/DEAH box helicase [Microbulbifer marinus]SDZ85672.1 Helicase conserved C-terminal domain-containing protein [Microbulbifer marinus]
MAIAQFLKRFAGKHEEESLSWRIDPVEGLDFIFKGPGLADPEGYSLENPIFGMKYAYLKSLHEQGVARRNANCFTVSSSSVSNLDEDFAALFRLPPLFEGAFKCLISGSTGKSSFAVRTELVLPAGEEVAHFSLRGPFLFLGETEQYRLTPAQWSALQALVQHEGLSASERNEYENNWLIFELQTAKKAGAEIDLAHFNQIDIVRPESVGVGVEELETGDLVLTPTFGPGIDLNDVKRRLGQIGADEGRSILRVNNRFVLLDQERVDAVEEILTNRVIPKSQVESFFESPTAYLNAAMIDLDTGFSLRVLGAEHFEHKYFGDVERSSTNWFDAESKLIEPTGNIAALAKSRETLDELIQRVSDAQKLGATVVEFDGRKFDVSDVEAVEESLRAAERRLSENEVDVPTRGVGPDEAQSSTSDQVVIAIGTNDEEEDFCRETELNGFDVDRQDYDKSNLKRAAFPHQDEGIRWLLAHMESTLSGSRDTGALLADDMGLGKTYMTLVAASEYLRRMRQAGGLEKPVMIVAPLSLLENWQSEVFETFHKSPFQDIVTLQAGVDLKRFRVAGAGRETSQEAQGISNLDSIRYSLKVGKLYGKDRLDMPGRLVLTTYQTLRDYQFSLSRVDWSIVAFDEAQNIKNPNALATRAAKALKADFKLLASGTPVENSLKDFWCLMDTAVPGLLGAWQSFRENYISPILDAAEPDKRDVKITVGKQLRDKVGVYMLRRTKEERLDGLPKRTIYSGNQSAQKFKFQSTLAGMMKGPQLSAYEDIVSHVKNASEQDRRGVVLPSLLKLKVSSIHHRLLGQHDIPSDIKGLIEFAKDSVKIESMLSVLDEIRSREEKVIIFATTKSIQRFVCVLISSLYKIKVDIINGDTKAVSTRQSELTRKSIIDAFQSTSGFGVIVMSPVAAGVGLTVTGANNVIHLERHWNPAKEAQATDRVYRIGQRRNVNVYLPMALHPEIASFDLQLDSLLSNKIDLSDAVVANEAVEASDFGGVF